MVGETMARDLLKRVERMIVFGDPAQLPPVNDTGYFMRNPDFTLTKIHRQAAESPIIKASIDIREGRGYGGVYGDAVRVILKTAVKR
jgi:exodeoxyribonuclease-5